jgi:molybdate/tungstate transport system substrate-binding protein
MTKKSHYFFSNKLITRRFGRLWLLTLLLALAFSAPSCDFFSNSEKSKKDTLHVIHAGSLTYPVKKIIEEFIDENPGVTILSEVWGSKAGARRVIDLETPCDVFLSADYMVIKRMLIPDHAGWYIKFATNEMAIVYTPKSRYFDEINAENWHEIMLRPSVEIGRSSPDHDPCGYRTVFTLQLTGLLLGDNLTPQKILEKSQRNIRPKETDLIALLESNHVDYIFLYRSVAQQHKLPYLMLPDEINLKNPDLDSLYSTASVETIGATPDSTIIEKGEAMVYGVTIPLKSKNKQLAEKFVAFLLSKENGLRILEELGQPGIVPSKSSTFGQIPNSLKRFAIKD